MLKSLATTFLLLAFLVQSLNRFVVVIDYYANTQAFAINCENKAIPQLHCNGKCQMMKKMQAEEKKESQASAKKIAQPELIFSETEADVLHAVVLSPIKYYFLNSGRAIGISSPIFHPPGISA